MWSIIWQTLKKQTHLNTKKAKLKCQRFDINNISANAFWWKRRKYTGIFWVFLTLPPNVCHALYTFLVSKSTTFFVYKRSYFFVLCPARKPRPKRITFACLIVQPAKRSDQLNNTADVREDGNAEKEITYETWKKYSNLTYECSLEYLKKPERRNVLLCAKSICGPLRTT